MRRANVNLGVLTDWAAKTPWIDFFAEVATTRSNTSVTLKVVDPDVLKLDLAGQEGFVRAIAGRLDKEGVAYDIAFHRDAPPHFRIWAGATIEPADLAALTEWIEWGYTIEKASLKQAA
jgi:phosphoserine aminotransferase